MYNDYLILIGLFFNFAGAIFLAFSFTWKNKKEVGKNGKTYGTITMGKDKKSSRAGIILLIFGFGIQVVAVIMKMASN